MVLADSHRVPRVPWYLGADPEEPTPFSPTGLLPSMAALSRDLRLTGRFVTPRPPCEGVRIDPTTPVEQRSHALTHDRFGLFPFRSPLLRESRLLSLPGGTEMVHFPPFAPPFLWIQKGVTGHDSRRVSPFGHPRLSMQQLTEAYRSLRRPSSPPSAKASTVRP
jgi:hypothetical protein